MLQSALIIQLVALIMSGNCRLLKQQAPGVNEKVRAIAQELVDRLKADDPEGLMKLAKERGHALQEEDLAKLKEKLLEDRVACQQRLGKPLGDIEFVKAQVASPSLARLIYLEKYPRGGVLWWFTFYDGQDGWKLEGFGWQGDLNRAFSGLP